MSPRETHMTLRRFGTAFCIVVVAALSAPVVTQQGGQQEPRDLTPEELRASMGRDLTNPFVPVPKINPATSRDWPLNHLDLKNSRYSTLTQINASNVTSLAVRW